MVNVRLDDSGREGVMKAHDERRVNAMVTVHGGVSHLHFDQGDGHLQLAPQQAAFAGATSIVHGCEAVRDVWVVGVLARLARPYHKLAAAKVYCLESSIEALPDSVVPRHRSSREPGGPPPVTRPPGRAFAEAALCRRILHGLVGLVVEIPSAGVSGAVGLDRWAPRPHVHQGLARPSCLILKPHTSFHGINSAREKEPRFKVDRVSLVDVEGRATCDENVGELVIVETGVLPSSLQLALYLAQEVESLLLQLVSVFRRGLVWLSWGSRCRHDRRWKQVATCGVEVYRSRSEVRGEGSKQPGSGSSADVKRERRYVCQWGLGSSCVVLGMLRSDSGQLLVRIDCLFVDADADD